MAIGLREVSNKSKKGIKSLLDVILERKEQKVQAPKEKVLRPWQLHQDGHVQYKAPKKTIMSPFEKSQTNLSEDEIMARKIRDRADELFVNIKDFLN